MEHADTFTFAQLTDAHLGPLPPLWPMHWNLKRIMGYFNFHTRRRAYDDPTLVRALVADLKTQRVDHIAVTGDIANLGLPAEFENGLAWLKTVGTSDDVTVIPGNHDIYTRLVADPGVERWRPYMEARGTTDAVPDLPEPLASGFPFVRTFGRFAFVCVNSAVPTPPGDASGRVGPEQLARLSKMLHTLHGAGYARIVLIHHPPLPEHGPRGLRDRKEFDPVLMEAGAELVLHGHNHRSMISWRDTATGPLPIIGAGATAEGVYNIYKLERLANGTCAVEVIVRGAANAAEPFKEISRVALNPDKEHRQRIM